MSTLRANTLKPITSGNSLVLQGDSGGSGVSGPSIDSNGDVDFTQNTDAKVKLPSGGGIYESDGSTQILTESSGTVTLDNVSFGTNIGNVPASKGASYELVKSSQGFAVDNQATTSSAYIENLFNSTYRDYVVYITGTVGTTTGSPQFRFGNSSGRNSNSNYSFVIQTEDSGNDARTYIGSDLSAAGLLNGAKGSGTFNRITITMTIHNPQASGGIFWSGTSTNPRSGTALLVNFFGGTLNEDYQATNMQFYFDTGSGTWNIQSYGIKTS